MQGVATSGSTFRSKAIGLLVVLALTWATLLLCDVATGQADPRARPAGSASSDGNGWPTLFSRLLAVPIKLTDVSDLRVYAIPMCLAGMLIVLSVLPRVPRKSEEYVENKTKLPKRIPSDSVSLPRVRRPHMIWSSFIGFEGLLLIVLCGALASSVFNDTWELSRGYLFFLTCQMAWAVLLSRVVLHISLARLFAAGSLLAVIAATLSLWHLYALGERFFQLPVGPITITAALGALWGAMAVAWIAGLRSSTSVNTKSLRSVLCAIVVASFALWMAGAAGRRGAFLAIFAAMVVVAGLLIWQGYPSKRVRAGLVAMVLLLAAGAGAYVRQQVLSPERVASVPLRIRFTYWSKALDMLRDRPLLGHGPDMFICDMTTALARKRAEMPTILHGEVDFDAHNEWIQALFELGVPAGLSYLALPLVAIGSAIGAWRKASDPIHRAALLACIAGLVDIVVAESSSINLRHAMLASWYWSILGLTVGLARNDERRASSFVEARHTALRVGGLALAVVLFFVVASDLRAALSHARGRSLMHRDDAAAVSQLDQALGRFGAARWISTRTYLGHSLSSMVRAVRLDPAAGASSDTQPALAPADTAIQQTAERAVAVWTQLQQRAVGYLDTGFRLAEATMLAGENDAAVRLLREYLDTVNPYDKQANSLLASIGSLTPMQQLDTVIRSLRADRWDSNLLARATQAMASPAVDDAWPRRVREAMNDLKNADAASWQYPLAPEILRVEVFRLINQGDMRGAAELQLRIARAYHALAESNDDLRRKPLPEAESWYLASRFLFEVDPAQYAEAHRRMVLAENYAIQGLMIEKVRRPQPGAPYVGGKVMPLDAPDNLRDLWRFSAMMYLAVKGDPQQITLRITWSLPPDRHDTSQIQSELGVIAAELVQRLSVLPEQIRPPSFPRLVELARQFGARRAAPSTGGP